MRSHFGKERRYMITRDGVEGVRERRARARTSSRSERCTYTRSVAYDQVLCLERGEGEKSMPQRQEMMLNDNFVINWDISTMLAP